ncbi:MAG: hypothetical protein L0322_06875, partial [Chloroflexi bacterium]|nr:hypothetical protein [Chloroflexota bacterium]
PASLFPNPAPAGELALAVQVQARFQWNKVASQAGLLFLEEEGPTSYQLLSFTSSATTAPAVLSDPAGYLYATWLEPGGSGFTVYFASTAPDLRQALRSLSSDDVGRLAAETLFGLLTGALLAPIAVSLWLILPGVLLLLTSVLRRREEKLTSPGTLVSVALAVAAFWVVKVASIPGLLAYAPFSAWLHLPGWMQLPLQIIVPLAIMIGAIVTAWHFTYRRDVNSLLYFILLYGAIDGLLTMAVYGVLVYGAL